MGSGEDYQVPLPWKTSKSPIPRMMEGISPVRGLLGVGVGDVRSRPNCRLLLWMTVTARALTARRRSLREVMKLETAVVDHVSTTRRLVTRKINDDADMSPAGLLLLVSRDGSRKEVDCDPRMGLVKILSSTRGGILACDPRGQAWGL